MADNEEKFTAPRITIASRPASTRSSSALGELKPAARVPAVPETPFTSRTNLIDADLYDVKLAALTGSELSRMEKQAQSSSPANLTRRYEAANDAAADGKPSQQFVHHSLYQKTSQTDIDNAKANAISHSNIQQGHALLKKIEGVFMMAGLLTIMNGARQPPQYSADNTHGWRPAMTKTVYSVEYRINNDDCAKWEHDYHRCFQLIFHAFDHSIYYLSQEGFHNQDPIRVYTDMKKHFHGHSGKDLIRIDRLIQDYKPDNNVSIQKDIVRLDNLFIEYEYTLQHKMYDEMKLARFMSLFQFDKRPTVEMCLANLAFVNCTYGQAFQAVMQLSTVIDLPPRHQMKALTSTDKKLEPCRGFAAGKCKFGDKCKYSHKGPSPATATSTTPPASNKPGSSDKTKTKAKKNPPAYITATHREFVGPPIGKVTDGNPLGFSRKQVLALSYLNRNSPSSATAHNDSWRDGSILNAGQHGSSQGGRSQMNMLRFTDEVDAPPVTPPPTDTDPTGPPPPAIIDETPAAVEQPTALQIGFTITPGSAPPSPALEPFYVRNLLKNPVDHEQGGSSDEDDDDADPLPDLTTILTAPVRAENDRHVIHIEDSVLTTGDRMINSYNQTIQDPEEVGVTSDYVMWVSKKKNDKVPRPILAIFGWLDRSTTFHYSDVRMDIRGAALPFMSLMYTLGKILLSAIVAPFEFTMGFNARSFMTYDTIDPVYYRPGVAGSYVSTVKNIEVYPATLKYLLAREDINPVNLQYYILTLIFDFAAFTAQTMRAVIEDRTATLRHLSGIRALMKDTLHYLHYNVYYDEDEYHFDSLFNCFYAIIQEINPIPAFNDYGTPATSPDTRPQKYQTPRTYHRQNSPARESPHVRYDEIPSNIFRRIDRSHPSVFFPDDEETDLVTVRPSTSSSSSSSSSSTTAFAPRAAAHATPIASTPDDYADYSILPTPFSIRPPTPPKRKRDDDSETDDHDHSAKLIITEHQLKSLSKSSKVVFDSGCSITGTSNIHDLHDVEPCSALSVQGAFGPSTQPQHRGKLGPLGLEAIVLEGMGNQTLISLSAYLAGGTTGTTYAGVFTPTEFRIYDFKTILPAISMMSTIGTESTRGTVQGGIYVEDS